MSKNLILSALLGLALAFPAAAQYTSGLSMDARGPYTNTYVGSWYAPPYEPVVPFGPHSRFSPILMTSINYPGVYGSYAMSVPALDYRGPVQFQDTVTLVATRLNGVAVRPATVSAAPAFIDVRLPATAELSFQGVVIRDAGSLRQFVSPPLELGRTFGYNVRATWAENSKTVIQDRHVRVSAGDRVLINFFEPEPGSEYSPKEESGTATLRVLPLR